MEIEDFEPQGRRLQFGSFNQPIGFWVGAIIGGLALLTLLVFLFWYACCFDTPRYIPKPESAQSGYASVESNEVYSNNEEEGGGGGDDGDGEDGGDGGEDGGNEDGGAGDGDEEGGGGGNGGGGEEEDEDGECRVVVTYDHCDLGQHAPEFKAAQRKAGLSLWTFDSLEGR